MSREDYCSSWNKQLGKPSITEVIFFSCEEAEVGKDVTPNYELKDVFSKLHGKLSIYCSQVSILKAAP